MALFPLGILSAAGAGGFEGIPAYDLISTSFPTGTEITFSSIPSDYKHLQVRWTARGTGNTWDLQVRMNGITTNSYARHHLQGNGSTVSSASQTNQQRMSLNIGVADGTNAASTVVAAGVLDILDYTSTTKNKTIRALFGGTGLGYGANRITLASGFLNNTSAISSITFFLDAGNFSNTSRFSLYGIKG
jgi:hypothetical protein